MKIAFLSTACFLGLLLGVAESYDNTVHFFQTAVVVKYLLPSITDDEKWLVALCAQLPDETEEYDAVKQYKKFSSKSSWSELWDWVKTENNDREMRSILANSEATRELVTIQQLLHGLTGGDAEEMRDTAKAILKTLAQSWKEFNNDKSKSITDKTEILCAIGFAVHLLGDTLAHKRLDSGGLDAPGKMYPTGMGHAYDGYKPDILLESVTGLNGIKYYSNQIPILFPERRLDADQLQKLLAKLEAANEMWGRWRAGNKAREEIIEEAESWAKEKQLRPDEHDNETCQSYLNNLIVGLNKKKQDQKDKLCAPACQSVFAIFADTAKKQFNISHQSRLPALSLDEYFYPKAEGTPLGCSVSAGPASGS